MNSEQWNIVHYCSKTIVAGEIRTLAGGEMAHALTTRPNDSFVLLLFRNNIYIISLAKSKIILSQRESNSGRGERIGVRFANLPIDFFVFFQYRYYTYII